MTNRLVVLDASAVLAWVLREQGHRVIDRLLASAVLPSSAMVEVLYRAPERGHRLRPSQLHGDLLALGLDVEPVTDDDTVRAAELIGASRSARTPADSRSLSLGDGLCLAVAERLWLPVSGGEEHWKSVDLDVAFFPFR